MHFFCFIGFNPCFSYFLWLWTVCSSRIFGFEHFWSLDFHSFPQTRQFLLRGGGLIRLFLKWLLRFSPLPFLPVGEDGECRPSGNTAHCIISKNKNPRWPADCLFDRWHDARRAAVAGELRNLACYLRAFAWFWLHMTFLIISSFIIFAFL